MLDAYDITSWSLKRLEELVVSFKDLKKNFPPNFEIDDETKIKIQGNFPITWFSGSHWPAWDDNCGMLVAFEKINLRDRPPLGFLCFANHESSTDLENAINNNNIIRHPGGMVTRGNIAYLDGYDAYTRRGDVMEIIYLSSFLRYRGVGKTLVDALKSKANAELIEVHFDENRKDLALFFEKQDFVNTYIKNCLTHEIYMVSNIRNY